MSLLTVNNIDLPKFAEDDVIDGLTGQNNVVPAIVADQDFGWHPARRRPERNVMNWLHRYTYRQLQHMKEVFQPEVQKCLTDLDLYVQRDYYKAGLEVDINANTLAGRPVTVTVQPGRGALSEIGSVTPLVNLIVVDVPAELECTSTAEWTNSVSGVAQYHALTPGTPEDLHLFLIAKDPALGDPVVKLVFDFSALGIGILGSANVAAEGYTHLRRMFSFRCNAIDTGGGNNEPGLPYARIVNDQLSWGDHAQHSIDSPGVVTFNGGAGPAWSNLTNTMGANTFPIPGGVPLIMQVMFSATNIAVTGNQARFRGGNGGGQWIESPVVDAFNRAGGSVPLNFDSMPIMSTELYITNATNVLFSFLDLTVPFVGNNWMGIFISGYRHVNSDFPVLPPL